MTELAELPPLTSLVDFKTKAEKTPVRTPTDRPPNTTVKKLSTAMRYCRPSIGPSAPSVARALTLLMRW